MNDQTTTAQWHETYLRTVRDEPREAWPNWVTAVSNSLAAGEWTGSNMFPQYAKEVFELVKENSKGVVSMADSD